MLETEVKLEKAKARKAEADVTLLIHSMQPLIRERIAPGLSNGRHVFFRGVSGHLVSQLHRFGFDSEVC